MTDPESILRNIPGIRTEASPEIRADVAKARQVVSLSQRDCDQRTAAHLHAYISMHDSGNYRIACKELRELVDDLQNEFDDLEAARKSDRQREDEINRRLASGK